MAKTSVEQFSGRIILVAKKIYQENLWLENHALVIEEKKIRAIIPTEMIEHHLPAQQFDFPHHYLLPGMIDLHIHGANGFDVMDGTIEALQAIANALAQEGVTSFLATTMTAEKTKIEIVMECIAQYHSVLGAKLLGVHLEGPFISLKKKGAQDGNFVISPDLHLFKSWQTKSNDAIKLITLAPELPNSLSFIQALHHLGIIVSIGHTEATYEETEQAISAGASHATHLFNAMRGIHHRSPGPSLALLLSPHVTAELILDEWHLHPALVELAYSIKGRKNLILVSDAVRAKCMQAGHYELGGNSIVVENNKVTLSDGVLAGSVLTLPQALKRWMSITGNTLLASVPLVTSTPARVLKLFPHKGMLSVGYDADCVVMDDTLNVALTVREGEVVYRDGDSL